MHMLGFLGVTHGCKFIKMVATINLQLPPLLPASWRGAIVSDTAAFPRRAPIATGKMRGLHGTCLRFRHRGISISSSHRARMQSIEAKKWHENAGHIA